MSCHRTNGREDEPLDPIELEAARWLVRRDNGWTRDEEQECARWLAQDERHAAFFRRLEEAWGQLDRLRAVQPKKAGRGCVWWRQASALLAAAACIAFAFLLAGRSSESGDVFTRRIATSVGGFERIELPDGSVVHLNTASAVQIEYTATARRVSLQRGEASFTVAKSKARPFTVRAGQVNVRAVGTAFNVRLSSESIEVLVTEGVVQVNEAVVPGSMPAGEGKPHAPGAEEVQSLQRPAVVPLLAAGQRAVIPAAPVRGPVPAVVVPVAPAEVARATAWQFRRLEFSNEPLANVVAEFNRYNERKIVIDDEVLAAMRFGGKFPANDIDALVRLLERNFGVTAERRGDETYLRLASRSRP